MADSTTNINQILSGQTQPEIVINANFNAASAAMAFGIVTTIGLTLYYYGGVVSDAGTPTHIANGSLTLPANDTTYIYRTSAGAVTQTTTEPAGWPGPLAGDAIAMYDVLAGSSITSWNDHRTAGGDKGATGADGAAGADGANWAVSVNAQTGTTYSLQASDNGKVITCSNGSAITVTVPSGLGANFSCEVIQIGAGQVTFAASGTTLNSYLGYLKLSGQHAAATLVAYVADTFNISGNITT